MAQVKWRKPNSFTVHYEGGIAGTLTLTPGVNSDINDDEFSAFVKHPIVKLLIDDGSIAIMDAPPASTLEHQGFAVIDDAETGQPLPVQPVSTGVKAKPNEAAAQVAEREKAKRDKEVG